MSDLPPPPPPADTTDRLHPDLAAALREHSPQVNLSAPALFPLPSSPTGWVLVAPTIPVTDADVERLGYYLTLKHVNDVPHGETDEERTESIVRTTLADFLLVLSGRLPIDDFKPNYPEPPKVGRFTLPPHLQAQVDQARARATVTDADLNRTAAPVVADESYAGGRAVGYVTAGIPHSFRARSFAPGQCECGLPEIAPVHKFPRQ